MGYTYNFPKIKGLENFNKFEQLDKIEEEVDEIRNELSVGDDRLALIEAVDLIVATETFLRLFPDDMVQAAADLVLAKNKERGYWKKAVLEGEQND